MIEDINLNEYKEQLVNFFVYQCDFQDTEKRRKAIANYDDAFLKKIIDDTKYYISCLLEKMFKEQKVFKKVIFDSIEISNDEIKYLHNDCTGGWMCDEIFQTIDGKQISLKILQNFFGKNFRIEISEHVLQDNIRETFLSFVYFEIAGPIEEFKKLYLLNGVCDIITESNQCKILIKQ